MSMVNQIAYEDAASVTLGATQLDADGFMVGVSGSVNILTKFGDQVTIPSVPAGQPIPIAAKKLLSGGTATGVVALWANRRPEARR